MTVSLVWVIFSLRNLQTSKLRGQKAVSYMGLELGVGVSWESPAVIKHLGMDDRGRKAGTQTEDGHGRRGAGAGDRKSS